MTEAIQTEKTQIDDIPAALAGLKKDLAYQTKLLEAVVTLLDEGRARAEKNKQAVGGYFQMTEQLLEGLGDAPMIKSLRDMMGAMKP
jgi:hypothetical protein